MGTAYIVDAVRTARGRGKPGVGKLSSVHPQELLGQALNGLRRTDFNVADVEDVVAGVVQQAGEQGACLARSAVLCAGWPDVVTGVSLNRYCGSGLQGVNFAAMAVASELADLMVGGGVESMSRVPMGSDGGGLDGNNAHLIELHPIVPQGISADLIATLEKIGREECDRFALQSQQRAERAMKDGRYKSLVPVTDLAGNLLLDRDEHPRAGTTLEGLAQLQPSFAQAMDFRPKVGDGSSLRERVARRYPQTKGELAHVHTAGNSSGIVDGASAVLLASERYVKKEGLRPRAKIRATATIGVEPVIMLTAPGPAAERALRKAGMKASDVDVWEINEAFAVVPLKMIRDLDLDPARVNPNGGAIALGHPLGATGGMLIGTLLDELERTGKSVGCAAMCIGGGMGIATIVERV